MIALDGVDSTTGTDRSGAETVVRRAVEAAARRPPGDFRLDATWRELAIDSLDLLQLILDCERAFGVPIPDDAVLGFGTPADVVAFAERVGRSP